MADLSQLVFIDSETTGLYPDNGAEIWEFALIDGASGEEREWHVQHDAGYADPMSLRMNHYYERWENAVPTAKVAFARELEQWVRGKHLVGAVPDFDVRFLIPLFRYCGVPCSWHYHLIDVEALAVGYIHGQGDSVPVPWKSDDLSRAIGIEPPSHGDRHTALGDAHWAKRIYEAVTG